MTSSTRRYCNFLVMSSGVGHPTSADSRGSLGAPCKRLNQGTPLSCCAAADRPKTARNAAAEQSRRKSVKATSQFSR